MKMCFSTEAADLDHQAPNRNKRESKYYWDELYTLICAGGFNSLEIPYEAKWDFGGRSGVPRSIRSIMTKFGSIQNYMTHLSHRGINAIDCIHLDPSLFCQGALDMYFGAFGHYAEEAIQLASEAGSKIVTLSVTPPYYAVNMLTSLNDKENEALFLDKTARIIEAAATAAKAQGIRLCVKNEYWGLLAGEKIVSFISGLNTQVFLDVDTAHLQISGVSVTDFIRANKGRIGVVHFTDTAFVDHQNAGRQPLPEFPAQAATKVFRDIGDGTVDFKAITDALKDVGYDGIIVCNCRNSYDICRSILRTRYYIDHVLSE